jgi:hypothetical protein
MPRIGRWLTIYKVGFTELTYLGLDVIVPVSGLLAVA